MPQVTVLDPLPALACECCGEPADKIERRHAPHGLAVGSCCLRRTGSELAAAYGRRLRRIAER
jgi:hypothetical protein